MAFATINKGSSYFNTKLYTGNGSATQSITGVGFKPDLVWVKNRTAAVSHCWVDGVRAAPNQLGSDLTDAENSSGNNYVVYGGVSVLGSDGFTASLGSDPTYQATNKSAQNYVAWNWLAANSTTSNTSGTISSTVSVNTTAGFSIVSYTGTGANATVGHGLGVAPKMVIIKNRTSAENWRVGHSSLTSWAYRLILDSTSAQTSEPNAFNSTAPTSTVFSVGTDDSTNKSTNSLIAYCFAAIKGYSKFGSYTGNGSSDGTFVYTGFKPAFVMMKNASASLTPWFIFDVKRNPSNETDLKLNPNSSDVESSANPIDILSNGFKLRTSGSYNNGSGNTIIYMAFAENPFVLTDGTPVTAR